MEENIQFSSCGEKNYPEPLKLIPNHPRIIYYRGDLNFNKNLAIAVVGTRRCSDYGKQTTIEFVNRLSEAGFTIISGLAKGIDSIAHRTALENKTKTIAVLGSGIDKKNFYPKENIRLMERILESGGAIISEYPPGTKPEKYHFQERNRIISGLSQAILVVEAKEKSGALITANFGFSQKKPVFSVPGSIYNKNSLGCHGLIERGAKIAYSPEIILNNFGIILTSKKNIAGKTKEEEAIINLLKKGALHIDKIIQASKISAPKIISSLTELEFEGKIKNLGGNFFSLNK